MLNAMRVGAGSKIVKFIVFSFLLFAVAGMALMDVGGFFRSGGTGSTTVATVAGQKINSVEFDRTIRRAISQQGMMDTKMAYQLGLIDQYLNSQITGMLLQKTARDQGILINDQMVAQRISELVAPYVKDGNSARDAFNRILMAQNLTEGEFVSMLRGELTGMIIRTGIQNASAVVSDAEVKDLYQQQHEERTIKLLYLPNNTAKGVEKPSDEVLRPFYQSGQEKYAIPETRTFTLTVLTEDVARKSLDVSDEELKQVYEERLDEYTDKEKRVLQQAIFTSEASAKETYDKVKAGSSLKDAAKDSYIGEEAFEEAGLLAEISDVAFALAKGEVSEPIKTSLGWHVLVLKDTLAPKIKSFDSVKEAIKKEIIEEKAANQLVETANQLDDALAGGEPLADVARDFQIELKKIGPIRQDGSTPDNKEGLKGFEKSRPDILEVAFSLEAGETSSVQELSDGTYAVVQIDTVTPKTYKEFDSVKAELAKLWISDQEDVLNRRRATEILQAIQAGTKTLEQAASDVGTTIKTLTVNNSKPADPPLTEPLKNLLFENDKGTYQMAPSENGYALAVVTAVKMPDPAKADKADLETLRQSAKQNTQNEIFMVFYNEMHKKHGVKINRKLLDNMYAANSEPQF